jgi:hypothetical protein
LQNASMQNQLTQQQLASAKLTYDQAKGAQDFIAGIMTKAQENGSNVTDPFAAAKQMLNHPNPAVQAVGTHLLDAHQKVRAFEQQQAWEAANAPGPGATGGTFAPGAVPMPLKLTTPVDLPPLSDGAAPSNALAPAAAAPVAPVANAFVKPGAVTPESVAAQIKKGDMLYGAAPGWKADRELLVKQYEAVLNPRQRAIGAVNAADYTPASIAAFNTSGNYADLVPKAVKEAKTIGTVNPSDFTAASVAKFNTTGNYADLVALPPKPGTVVNVSQTTEKKYGEAFGGKIADRDVAMLDVAAKAPDLAANANRVLSILSQGNVFTGSAADIKLNMARALNLAGAGNDEKIANTEMLVSGLARQTLGAVKSSGLGTGQGFTDKDLQFLQDAEGGRITLNAQTIQRLAELSHSAADKSATAWNKRVKEIPKSATEGTGLSTEPIVVPKRLGAAPAAPATGAVQNGYRFKGGDPAVAANWEKL